MLSGVVLFGLDPVLPEVADGFVELLGLVEFMSGLVLLVPVLLVPLGDEALEFGAVVSELLVLEDGVVADVPDGVDELDGFCWLCALLAPLPAPFASLLPIVPLCAIARPVEKITAVAIVRSFLLILVSLLSAD